MTNSFFIKMNKPDTTENREKISDEITNLFTSSNVSFLSNGNLVIETSDNLSMIRSKLSSLDGEIRAKRAGKKFIHKTNNVESNPTVLDISDLS